MTWMTRALFLAPAGTFARLETGSSFTLGGSEGRHASAVRRIRCGEWVDVADGCGVVATCEVTATAKDALSLRIGSLVTVP